MIRNYGLDRNKPDRRKFQEGEESGNEGKPILAANTLTLERAMKRIILSVAIIHFCFGLTAQSTLNLIPYPRNVKYDEGGFEFNKEVKICTERQVSRETEFAISQLEQELMKQLAVVVSRTTKSVDHSIHIGLIQDGTRMKSELNEMELQLPAEAREEGYILVIQPGKIVLGGYTEAGLFYGVQTLRQLIRLNMNGSSLPSLLITDWPGLRYRGWMDDISRGPVPTVEFVKECIRTMAEYKQNYFNLYTEHTFTFSKYPDLAPPGSFTAGEIKELAEYASKYHMDLVGNFQSFGHMEKILANPFFSHLQESGSILNPADEASYRFLADLYSEIVPAYSSGFFNINCDETQGLGEGKSKAMADSIGTAGIYAYHINRVNDLLKPYGKRIMMWGDIAVGNTEIIGKLPKDLIILSWGYGAEDSFDQAIIPFQKTGFDFMVAPGVSCWGEVWPGMSNAAVNISNYVRDGAKLGAMGMMNTAWDDNGHNLFNYNWHGLLWGAECSWNPAKPLSGTEAVLDRSSRLEQFNKAFDAVFFHTPGITAQLFQIDSIRSMKIRGMVGETAFWQDIMEFYPENITESAVEANQAILERAEEVKRNIRALRVPGNHDAMLDGALLALERICFTAEKNIARVHLYRAYESGTTAAIRQAKEHLAGLQTHLYTIKKEYIRLWNMENRSWWLDKNLSDYNRLARQLQDADKKVLIRPLQLIRDNKRAVLLRTLFNDKTIRFTLDGSTPTARSGIYSDTLWISGKCMIRSMAMEDRRAGAIAEQTILMHQGIGHFRKLNSFFSSYNPAYAAGGEQALVDGVQGSENFADGHWQGFQGTDLDIELDFGKVIPVNTFDMGFLRSSYSWILLPAEVRIFASNDGVDFHLVRTIDHTIPQDDQKLLIHNFQSSFDNLRCRYLKVVAKNPGPLPAWHHAPGNPSFIFADEIIIQ